MGRVGALTHYSLAFRNHEVPGVHGVRYAHEQTRKRLRGKWKTQPRSQSWRIMEWVSGGSEDIKLGYGIWCLDFPLNCCGLIAVLLTSVLIHHKVEMRTAEIMGHCLSVLLLFDKCSSNSASPGSWKSTTCVFWILQLPSCNRKFYVQTPSKHSGWRLGLHMDRQEKSLTPLAFGSIFQSNKHCLFLPQSLSSKCFLCQPSSDIILWSGLTSHPPSSTEVLTPSQDSHFLNLTGSASWH